jgi:hypothetical protein
VVGIICIAEIANIAKIAKIANITAPSGWNSRIDAEAAAN